MIISRKFGYDYWDGDRRYGYGGFHYDGRWKPVAQELIDIYSLDNSSAVLDVGCGKAYLLHELKNILPGLAVSGFDISEYAINASKEEIKQHLFVHDAQDAYPFGDKVFDLTLSLTTLHNLKIAGLKSALQEIERVSKQGYIVLDSYRNEKELFNLQCWGLTCEQFFRPEEWTWFFNEFAYSGDYEFIYFE
jgi:ubiquinone/menaquinone biosynthesis C-methylase UbiE